MSNNKNNPLLWPRREFCTLNVLRKFQYRTLNQTPTDFERQSKEFLKFKIFIEINIFDAKFHTFRIDLLTIQ